MACNYNLYSKSETVINSLGIFSNFYKIFKTIKNQIIVKRKTIFRHFRLEEIKSLLLMIIIIVIILLFSFIQFKNHFVRMIVRQIHIVLIVSIIAISPPPYSCFPFLLPWSFVENEEKYLNRIREIENKLYQPHGNPSSSRNFLRKYGDIKSSFLKTLGWRQRSFVAREISRARVLKGARESRGRPSLEYF